MAASSVPGILGKIGTSDEAPSAQPKSEIIVEVPGGQLEEAVSETRQRIRAIAADPNNLIGEVFPDTEDAKQAYFDEASEHLRRMDDTPFPIITAVTDEKPDGRYPWDGEFSPEENARVFHTIVPIVPKRRSPENHPKHNPELITRIDKDPSLINTEALPFEKLLTDNMTVAVFKDGEWQDQVVPAGHIVEDPANTQKQYPLNVISGIPAYKKDDQVFIHRLPDHVKRLCHDMEAAGLPVPDEAYVESLIKKQALADIDWIPEAGNEVGNRYYIRMSAYPSNIAPPLAGPNATITVEGYPLGTYKRDALTERMNIALIREERPVFQPLASHKVGTAYQSVVKMFKEHAWGANEETGEDPDIEALFTKEKKEGIWKTLLTHILKKVHGKDHYRYIQEGIAANFGLRFKGLGKGGKDLVIVPPPKEAGALPGITSMTMCDLAEARGCEVVQEMISIEMMKQADEIVMMGTATEIVRIGRVHDDDGVLYKESITGNEDSLFYLLAKDYREILAGEGPKAEEFAHWRVPIRMPVAA